MPGKSSDLQILLAESNSSLRAGDIQGAEEKLVRILEIAPSHSIAHFLLGIVHAERKEWPEAERCYRQALALTPGQPDVSINLAYVLRAQHRPSEAIAYCNAVLAKTPDRADALLELGKAQQEFGDLAGAEASFRKILRRLPGDWAEINLAGLLNAMGRPKEAEALLQPLLNGTDRPVDAQVELEHQLGRSLKSQRKYDAALERLNHAHSLGRHREVMLERALVLQHLSRFEEAASEYSHWLEQSPEDLPVHLLLNEIYYRHRQEKKFLSSYDHAAELRPQQSDILTAKANYLLKVDRPEQAHEVYQRALKVAPTDAAVQTGLARVLEALKDDSGARQAYESCLANHPDKGEVLEDYAGFQLRQGEPAMALRLSERAIQLRPMSQGAYAMLSLCYRALNDAREEDLNRYGSFVQAFDLEPPVSFTDMSEFNRQLDSYLAAIHPAERDYFTQTARGGSRTVDEIFFNGHKLVDLLQPRIAGAIKDYATRLASSGQHPFLSRRTRGFRYAGSWSSRLGDCGFHVNHIHQKGWISACYYVGVPDIVADAPGQQGWIKFGEPSTEYGTTFGIRRAIQPKPGRLVLFPSYTWHGTVPFHSPQARTTIAFDVVPA